MASVSIVILNFNGRDYLEKFLPSVIQHAAGCDIVIADNHSSDDSVGFLQKEFPQIKLVLFAENHGFCGGYNKVLAQLHTDYFILLNSDIEVTKNWISPIIALMESDPMIAAAQPKLLDFNHRDKFEYAGGAGGFMDKFGYPFCRGRIFDVIETDHGQYDDTREVFWASGACLFIKSKLFKQFGGFDEDFFAHMEEIDLCWRMKRQGYKIFSCGQSHVYHVGGGTLAYANPYKTYLNFRNSLLVMVKNLNDKELLWKIIFRVLMDYIAACKFLITGRAKDALMILKAHIYVLNRLKANLAKRTHEPPQSMNRSGIYARFLLFQYYLLGKKRFSDMKIKGEG